MNWDVRRQNWRENNSTEPGEGRASGEWQIPTTHETRRKEISPGTPECSRAWPGEGHLGFPSCLRVERGSALSFHLYSWGFRTADVLGVRPFGHWFLEAGTFACVCKPLMLLYFQRHTNALKEWEQWAPFVSNTLTHTLLCFPRCTLALETITQKLLWM